MAANRACCSWYSTCSRAVNCEHRGRRESRGAHRASRTFGKSARAAREYPQAGDATPLPSSYALCGSPSWRDLRMRWNRI
eukprot:scaffold82699_cov35-Tisochrysis_lutea.AAC.2